MWERGTEGEPGEAELALWSQPVRFYMRRGEAGKVGRLRWALGRGG